MRIGILVAAAVVLQAETAAMTISKTTCEYRVDPLGIDAARPRLSWILESSEKGQKQTAYQIVSSVWDSGRIESDQSAHVAWGGPELQSRQRVTWTVRVWDKNGKVAESKPSVFEMGLLKPEDWKAQWIGLAPKPAKEPPKLQTAGLKWIWYPEGEPIKKAPAETRLFRRTIELDEKPKSAWAILTADDLFSLYVNGEKAGGGAAWTQFEVIDITSLLVKGENTIQVEATNGGGPAGLIGQLQIDSKVISTDKSWQTAKIDAWVDAKEIAKLGEGEWAGKLTEQSLAYARVVPPTCFKKTFTARSGRARVYASALGIYELYLNGERVGNDCFAPGWTDYNHRVQYQTYEVALREGENELSAVVADGWYAGGIGWKKQRHCYGPYPLRLLAQLEVDGKPLVVTDSSWQASWGPILSSSFLDGEVWDARISNEEWKAVEAVTLPKRLVAQPDAGVQVTQTLKPIAITEPKPGVFVYDLGQNMVGWARIKVRGEAGMEVSLRFAEMLNPDGTIYTTNLRSAQAVDRYILQGARMQEEWAPHFTFHGFRYVEATGIKPDELVGVVAHSATPLSGTFECSNAMVNKLQSNIVWGQRGNFLSVPTDCPQRDERLGWMGDAQVFVGTACFNMDVSAFFTKWLRDVRDAQSADGGYPDVAPRIVDLADGAPAWGDAGVICPWTIWQRYGDLRIVEENYDAMARWIEFIRSANPDLLWVKRVNNNFGDWLSINDDTDKQVLSTAFFAYDAKLLSQMAAAIGRNDDARKYEDLFQNIRTAFNKAYVAEDGRIRSGTQTVYALALRFDLTNKREAALRYLLENISKRDGHLSTGFVGVSHLMHVLPDDAAYKLLLNESFPSWGYSIKHGATTIWERWDGWTKEKGFQDPAMNSFNHYSLGSVGDWLYRGVAGIAPAAPGYKQITIRPRPGGGLTWAKGAYDSIYGKIASDWKIEGRQFRLKVRIPVNTTASVVMPDGAVHKIGSGDYEFECSLK